MYDYVKQELLDIIIRMRIAVLMHLLTMAKEVVVQCQLPGRPYLQLPTRSRMAIIGVVFNSFPSLLASDFCKKEVKA